MQTQKNDLQHYLNKLENGSHLISTTYAEKILREMWNDVTGFSMGAAIDRNSAVHQKIDSLELELSSLRTAHNEATFNYTFAHSRLIELQKKISAILDRIQNIRQGQLELEQPIDVRPQE